MVSILVHMNSDRLDCSGEISVGQEGDDNNETHGKNETTLLSPLPPIAPVGVVSYMHSHDVAVDTYTELFVSSSDPLAVVPIVPPIVPPPPPSVLHH